MKPQPDPHVSGNSDSERLGDALGMVLTVSKKDLLKRRRAGVGRRKEAGEET